MGSHVGFGIYRTSTGAVSLYTGRGVFEVIAPDTPECRVKVLQVNPPHSAAPRNAPLYLPRTFGLNEIRSAVPAIAGVIDERGMPRKSHDSFYTPIDGGVAISVKVGVLSRGDTADISFADAPLSASTRCGDAPGGNDTDFAHRNFVLRAWASLFGLERNPESAPDVCPPPAEQSRDASVRSNLRGRNRKG